ncbi:MAG: nucleotide exchange factor GrpE [Methylococcaceae bacterium]|nr:nucleotide exchange factor GrpE [Methylococcaceae bacterium]
MTTEAEKSELLEQFQTYLEQSNVESFDPKEQPDLNSLLSELTGLKTEVKAESRQFKNTLDTLSSALTTVQEDNQSLSAELIESTQRLEKQHTENIRNMLLDFVDIYDKLSMGRDTLENYQPVNSLFKNSRQKDIHFIKRFKQGQDMTLNRFDQLLRRYKVSSIDCVGKLFDPVTMHAVETACSPKLENGIVMEELRKGFLFQDQVLRLAEVRVNKIS